MSAPESILKFVGYGSLDAPLWFIGMEESVGDRDTPSWSHAWEIDVRTNWPSVIDMRLAHEQLKDPYWTRKSPTPVWTKAAKLARGMLEHAANWDDIEEANSYVRELLGRTAGKTLLGEVLPLPKKDSKEWPNDYKGWYPTREEYENIVRPQRLDMWRTLIHQHKPEYVCFYGAGSDETNWDRYKTLVGDANWSVLHPADSTKRNILGVRVADVASTRYYLLPFFGQGRIRDEDLDAVVNSAR